jgi:hypothetical protein
VLPANVSQGTPVELTFQLTPSSGLTPEQAKANAEMQALAQSAIEAMRAGRDDEAIQQFSQIVLKVPTCSDCYYNLGVAYSKKQRTRTRRHPSRLLSWRRTRRRLHRPENVHNAQKKFDRRSRPARQRSRHRRRRRRKRRGAYNQGVILWNAVLLEAKASSSRPRKRTRIWRWRNTTGMANLNLGQILRRERRSKRKADPTPQGRRGEDIPTAASVNDCRTLTEVRARIAMAARSPDGPSIRLIAVSKTFLNWSSEAYAVGQRFW